MSDRYFLDTNVFVHSFDATSSRKRKRALELIGDAIVARNGIVSYQVVQEFFNAALKTFTEPMKGSEAEQYLAAVFRPLLAVHSSPALYVEALRLSDRYSLQWYDSLIVAAAREGKCSVLYSEDLQNGMRIDGLSVQNPFL
jgi:predicted nucleic acid-binding protein